MMLILSTNRINWIAQSPSNILRPHNRMIGWYGYVNRSKKTIEIRHQSFTSECLFIIGMGHSHPKIKRELEWRGKILEVPCVVRGFKTNQVLISFSQNGTSIWTLLDLEELPLIIKEAMEKLPELFTVKELENL